MPLRLGGRSGRSVRFVAQLGGGRTAGGGVVDIVVGTCFVARYQRFDDELDGELVDSLHVLRVPIAQRGRDGGQERFLDALLCRAGCGGIQKETRGSTISNEIRRQEIRWSERKIQRP